MKVFFGQIYIKPGISFDFSHRFQVYLGEQITELVEPSSEFIERYGVDYDLMFRISAKQQIAENEIRGPTVFKRDKDIEFTIFLPFDVIKSDQHVVKCALGYLFKGITAVFGLLSIDTSKILEQQDSLVESICSDRLMVE
jgi:hypothetical protein